MRGEGMFSRRDFGKMALAAVPLAAARAAARVTKINSKFSGVQIGAQSYSFRDRSLDACIDALKEVGLGECELYQGHVEPAPGRGAEGRAALKKWRLETPLEEFKKVRKKFDDAGIEL